VKRHLTDARRAFSSKTVMDDAIFKPAIRIALLSGGDSPEREVSLASGKQAEMALLEAGYGCEQFDPAAIDLSVIDWPAFDACFIALHGGAGEDGRVQAQLECLQLPYTGSGPEASALAMNKSLAKSRWMNCCIPTLPLVSFRAPGKALGIDDHLLGRLAELNFPLIIKPQSQGSSLGISVAKSPAELGQAIEVAAEFENELIAEPFVAGRELTVSLLGRRPLPLIEVIAERDVFDYQAKYVSGSTQYRLDSNLHSELSRKICQNAINAANAIGAEGLSRVDLMLDHRGNVWVLELNTIPGLTDHSLAPRAAAAAGISMPTLVDWMVRDAVRRFCCVSKRMVEMSP
jgi:D-alanine-D-alanine ligase